MGRKSTKGNSNGKRKVTKAAFQPFLMPFAPAGPQGSNFDPLLCGLSPPVLLVRRKARDYTF